MGKKKGAGREEDGAVGKSRKKAVVIDDDEYSIGTELSEEKPVQEEEPVVLVGGKKKGKKGNKKSLKTDEDEEDGNGNEEIKFMGKKKSKGKEKQAGSSFGASAFALLGDEDDVDEISDVTKDKDGSEDEDVSVVFSGKKSSNSKKGSSLFTGSAFGAIRDDDDDDGELVERSESKLETEDEDDEPVISFTGKKKSSKGNKKTKSSVFAALDDEENEKESAGDDDAPISFTAKKKKSNKKNVLSDNEDVSVSGLSVDDVAEGDGEDSSTIKFSGKKKSSKKKNGSAVNTIEDYEQPSTSITGSKEPEVQETSKNKKKKKKSGRTAQEEDDLDKILAELGEAPAPAQPSASASVEQLQEKVQTEAEPATGADEGVEKDATEEVVESAAAKKKKKKKEKEKEKKAAAAAPAVEEKAADSKGKVPDKKVPKHVREMQERLARLKEAEEKQKRDEEEKQRKEEEERLRIAEEEKKAEDKKRLKKEREREKLLKKKQEGKPLTAKQKADAQRLDLMRKQILEKAGGLPQPSGEVSTALPKRPRYTSKKPKPNQQAYGKAPSATENQEDNVSELGSVDTEKADDEEMVVVGEKTEAAAVEENGDKEDDESDDEWDAKSWDDADIKLPGISAFADEEPTEPETKLKPKSEAVVKKEETESFQNNTVVGLNLEGKESRPVTVVANKGRQDAKGKKKEKEEEEEGGEKTLRSPICCIMGHVDTGKTKLLDCIRRTNVQEGEAGGITQQIGATYIPAENIRDRTKDLKADAVLNVPGLLVIDTPGHESFKNLRSRGSGLCDIAILVVDIMHGLEPQTIESLNLLRMRNTEFIVALNKVDRLYGWKTCRNAPIGKALKQQSKDVLLEFDHRVTQIITQFKEQGLNTELYNKNKDRGETYSIVPTSAISGEGIPEMLLLLVQWAQKTMIEKLTYSSDIQCTVLEVKVIEGLGTTIDVVLVNGVLHEGDEIVVCGFQGPIHTTIRSLLTPHPMKELRVKGAYIHHKEIKAAQGIKITAQNLEHAVAGTALYVIGEDDDVEEVKESVMDDMRNVMSRIDKSGEGVYVQASTLGSLEALLEFLKTPAVNIPVSGIGIGPVHKKDVMKASVMLEKKKEFATILAFDVKVTPEAREHADDLGVKIFIADIIYHLFDQFKAYIDNLKEEKKREAAEDAVFPCVLQIMPNCVFNKKDPIILGVDVIEGILKIGTPICIPQREFIDIGRISSIENNHKPVDYAKKGQKVAIKITGSNAEEQQKMFGRHFEMEDELVSHISRSSIDVLKANYRDELSNEEWKLVVKLKHLFKIQ
uniref:eukaryotic translation initiation factor 5B-like n=1 Tax=Erigeron canadensis TaxID=72917 RepID=UPI001CB8BCC9|nr:eukaryotic translation initiation factor 5B-like [Erigeron canadensis]